MLEVRFVSIFRRRDRKAKEGSLSFSQGILDLLVGEKKVGAPLFLKGAARGSFFSPFILG